MKLVVAVIKPFKLNEVREALLRLGVTGMTATEVKGYGRQKGHTETYRGQEYKVDLLPKVKIELVVTSARADEIVRTLSTAARSGKVGDGKVFVSAIEEAVRIRTDEKGEAAV